MRFIMLLKANKDSEAGVEIRQFFEAADFAPQLADSDEGRALLKAEKAFRQRTNT